MIPVKNEVKSTIEGLNSQAFKIQVTDKSFRILFDGLYTNKHESIVRELWTNAYDSHVEAGHPERPFFCAVPTSLSPTFTVRDYGVSMDHDTIMNLYTTVFASTKTTTNEQIGCLGLGSKSPFSYTDSFTVTAFSGTEKRTYLVSMNNDGIPIITFLGTDASDEERGLEVSFAVALKDITDFRSAVVKVAEGFAVHPETNGIEFPKYEYILETDGLKIRQSNTYGTPFYVKQGPVMYPVPNDLFSKINRKSLISGTQWIVDVPIGSVEFTANREALQLTDATTDALVRLLSDAIEKTKLLATEDLMSKGSHREATKAAAYWEKIFRVRELGELEFPMGKDHYVKVDGYRKIFLNPKNPKHRMRLFKAGGKTKLVEVHGSEYSYATKNKVPVWMIAGYNRELHFVIDRGFKVPRKKMRALAYLNSLPYPSEGFYLEDPSPQLLAKLVRVWEPTKIVDVGSLPDPGPKSRTVTLPDGSKTSSDPDSLQSVYALQLNVFSRVETMDSLPENFKWLDCSGTPLGIGKEFTVPVSVSELDFTRNPSFRIDSNHWDTKKLLHMLKFLDITEPILLLGTNGYKKLSKAGLLNPKDEFEGFLRKKILDNAGKIASASFKISNSPPTAVYHHRRVEEMFDICPEMTDLPIVLRGINNDKIQGYLDENGLEAVSIKSWDSVVEKYPLLFNYYPTEEQIQEYIDFIDSKENK